MKYFHSFLALSLHSILIFFLTEAAQYECSYRRTAHHATADVHGWAGLGHHGYLSDRRGWAACVWRQQQQQQQQQPSVRTWSWVGQDEVDTGVKPRMHDILPPPSGQLPLSLRKSHSRTSAARMEGTGGNVTSAGWQVTPCDPIRYVSSRSGEASC